MSLTGCRSHAVLKTNLAGGGQPNTAGAGPGAATAPAACQLQVPSRPASRNRKGRAARHQARAEAPAGEVPRLHLTGVPD